MLTQLEMKTLDSILSICCRKGFTIPFAWSHGRLVVHTNRKIFICNCISWILLIPTIIFQFTQIPILIFKMNINGLILHGILTVVYISYAILKLNFWLFKEEIVQLMNHILCINPFWGKKYGYTPCKRSVLLYAFLSNTKAFFTV